MDLIACGLFGFPKHSFECRSDFAIKPLFWASGLTRDLEFDMSGLRNPKKKGEAMSGKVIIYGKAG